MSITAEELKADMEKYLLLAEKEDILISYRGRIVVRLSRPYPEHTVQERVAIANSLIGILPADGKIPVGYRLFDASGVPQ